MNSSEISRFPRVGFISTRVCGTDGVSLEIAKWADVLERLGHDCYYIAGKLDCASERGFLIEEADFAHPEIVEINEQCFGSQTRSRALSDTLHDLSRRIKQQLYEALQAFDLDLIVVQNALTIPMNIPLGAALVEVLVETGLPCIAHHHDFFWERERYTVNAVNDYLRAAFPPPLPQINHVVINSVASEEFSRRTGQSCRVIPNVMDFAHPPEPPDEYAQDVRASLGVGEDDVLVLQPTRIVQRKGIEHTIELVRRLDDPRFRLVVTHDGHDEHSNYRQRLCRFAELLGVPIIFAADQIGSQRGTTADGKKVYSIWDIYPHADLISYPSTYEGFGNAFLEAVYFRKPIFGNRYSIFRTDIEPFGFDAILMNGFLEDHVIERVQQVLADETTRRAMVERNFQVARKHFSYERLETELRSTLAHMHPRG